MLAQPWAEAIAIRGDKIVAVGSAKEIAAYRGASTKVIDAHGQAGFAGLHRLSHPFHGRFAGSAPRSISTERKTVAEIQKRVKEYAAAHPDETWILGMGWTYPDFRAVGPAGQEISG